MREFDLGQGGLFPIKLLEEDETTPVAGEYFCLSIGNQKSAFLPEHSQNVEEGWVRLGVRGWLPEPMFKDDDFSVSAIAVTGPDIWVDPTISDVFFVSDALALALKKAKADKGFSLRTCRVVAS